MSQNSSLSRSARLFCIIGPPSTILLTSTISKRTALLSPLAFAPTALFYRKWEKSNQEGPARRGELEPLIWTFALTGTVGLAAVGLVQFGVCSAAMAVLFRSGPARKEFWTEFTRGTVAGLTPDELINRARIARSWQNFVFNGVLSFVAAGLGEELLKYLPIAYARRRDTASDRQSRERSYLDYAIAGALSFGLVENIGFLYTACEVGYKSLSMLLLTVFERIIIGSSGHLLFATLTAARATRRDYHGQSLKWWSVVGPSTLLHGTFNFIALSCSAIEGNVGWIHPANIQNTMTMFGLLGGLYYTTVSLARKEWMHL